MIDFAKLVLAADTSQMKTAARDLEGVSTASGRAERAAQGLVRAIKVLSLGYAANLAIRQFTQATIENARVQAQLAAAIESTGGAAMRTQEELNATAATLQGISNYGDEAINAMQGLLLTFTQISGANFDRATKSILDVSTAMGTDLRSAALQVGKALNDPIQGLTALSRTGIQFSDAQKETIRSLMELGDVAGAQTVILEELERQFGGSAEAARGTLGGALTSLGNAWGDLFELSGDASDNLRDSIEGLIRTIQDPAFVEGFQAFGAGLFRTMTFAAEVVAGLSMALNDLARFVGLASSQDELTRAVESANAAMNQQIVTSGALATRSLPDGVRLTEEYTRAQLELARSTLAVVRAQQMQDTDAALADNPGYRRLLQTIQEIEAQMPGLILQLQEAQRTEFAPEIERATREYELMQQTLQGAIFLQQDMIANARQTTPEYEALVAEIARLEAGLDGAANGAVTLGERAAVVPPPIREAAGAAVGLAQNLGVASRAAAVLLQQLRAAPAAIAGLGAEVDGIVAGLERQNSELNYAVTQGWSQQAAQIKAARDEAIELALANGASIDAVAALGAEFDLQAQRAEELAGANSELNDALLAVSETAGGGGGGGGSTADSVSELAEEMKRATESIIEDANSTREAFEDGLMAPLESATDRLIDEMLDGFQGGMSSIRDLFTSTIKDMIAFALKNQINIAVQGGTMGGGMMGSLASGATSWLTGGMSGGMSAIAGATTGMAGLAGAIGAIAGPIGIAVGLLGLFGRKKKKQNDDDKRAMDERARLEVRLLELQGKTSELRRLEIASLSPANRALGRRIQQLEEEARIADERAGLESQILQLQGNTAEIRRLELAALDASNRALQEHIYALEDQAEAAAEAARVQDERMSLEQQRLELLGREDLLREMQLKSLDASNQALQLQIWALEDAAAAAEEASRIDQERLTLEQELLALQGDTAALRRIELEALDATNQSLQKEIWALEDALAISNERLALEKQLLQAQGDTAALRELELQALDASNQALQKQIWALEDQAAAAAAAEAVSNERLALEKELLALQGDTAALRQLELEGLDASNRALQMQIWALEDYQKALEGITPDSYATLIDYNRALAQAAVGMSPANSSAAPSYVNPVSPILAATSTYSGDPLLDEVRALRQENRDLLIRIDRWGKRTSDIVVNWELNGLPEERVA
jgi:hypothetical protein